MQNRPPVHMPLAAMITIGPFATLRAFDSSTVSMYDMPGKLSGSRC